MFVHIFTSILLIYKINKLNNNYFIKCDGTLSSGMYHIYCMCLSTYVYVCIPPFQIRDRSIGVIDCD